MFKKILLVLISFTLMSCNVSKSAIVTSKATPPKSKKTLARTSKTKKVTQPVSRKTNETSEVIESTSRTYVTNDIISNYIAQYKDVAMGNMKSYGIPASIILAQGILESGAGNGDLALTANNHFGIKCHVDWIGETVRHDDDASQECFRKYKEPGESFKDHALFLTGRTRYASLFDLSKDDYQAWAKGLRKAGYATDPRYPEKLISYIQRYHLDQFDAQVLGKEYTAVVTEPMRVASAYNPNATYYEVQKGDTLYSISKKFNLLLAELKQKNNLSENTLSIGQKLIVK